jgi:hypothetical protein
MLVFSFTDFSTLLIGLISKRQEIFLVLLTLEDGTEGLSRNDILATADCRRMGGIFVADIESCRERRYISPTLKDESVTNAVFGIVVAFSHCSTL